MDIFTIITSQVLIVFATLYLGTCLSERLPDIHHLFDRKPFNCRPCLSFHIAWMLSAALSVTFHSWLLWCIGVVVAVVLFAAIKYIDNKNIIE